MDVTKIKQSLSMVVANYIQCKGCHIVDSDHDRARSGHICPTCGHVSDGAILYFHVNIHILIDLIQESYHSISTKQNTEKSYEGEGPHDVSVVILFCTLREALLDNLINNIMKANNLPDGVTSRLLSDNKFHIQKQDKLFKSFTGTKWSEAIDNINKNSNLDFQEIDKFVVSVVKARNNFIHEGSKWGINRKLSTDCINNIFGLVKIYVELHNKYVHPYYAKSL